MNDARCKRKPDVRQRHLATVLEEEQEVRCGPQRARLLLHPRQLLPAEPQILADLCARYGLEMDPGSVPGLIERFGVRFPGEPL